MTFGENLKSIMEYYKITQEALGKKLGHTQQSIAKYVAMADPPKGKTIEKLAKALSELSHADISFMTLLPDGIRNTEDLVAVIAEEHERRGKLQDDMKSISEAQHEGGETTEAEYHVAEERVRLKALEHAKEAYGEKQKSALLRAYDSVNEAGQDKIVNYASDIANHPSYKK